MSTPPDSELDDGLRSSSSWSIPTKGAREFTRAASLLDLARDANPAIANALRSPHVALDAYGRILGISGMFARRLGFPAARMIGRRLRHRVLGADRSQFQSALAPARAAQLPAPLEVRLRASDERLLRTQLTPLAIAHAGDAVVIVFQVALPGVRNADDSAMSSLFEEARPASARKMLSSSL